MTIPSYTVYRSKRKSIKITLRTNGTLSVYCPVNCSKSYIESLILKNYSDLKARHNNSECILLGNSDDTLPYLGIRYPVVYNNVEKFSFDGKRFEAPVNTSCAQLAYKEFLRAKTKELVTLYVKEISKQFSLSFGKISIKAMYSRYGSCSDRKNLNFSLALAAFEPEFIKFVVCHELCHTVHLNHGSEFYKLLDILCPEHRRLKGDNARLRAKILKSIFFIPA